MRESRESQHGCRTGRGRRRIGGPGAVPVLVLVAALTLAGGCSTPTPSHAAAAIPTTGVPRPNTRTLQHSPMIAAGTSAADVSVAVSNALFDSAPTVVLAAEHDQPAQRAAAGAAARLGVPLLLVSATNRDLSVSGVAGEVHRLKATDVLGRSTRGDRQSRRNTVSDGSTSRRLGTGIRGARGEHGSGGA